MTQEARAHDVHGLVVVEFVLCRTGRVTDIKVIQGLPFGMTEAVVFAVSQIEFTPAEMNWHTVSQRIRFEFSFNEPNLGEVDPSVAAGRLVESVDISGNRTVDDEELLKLVKTKPGEQFSVQQMQDDLVAILRTGRFDSKRSHVSTELGARGGIVVVFEVVELPIISEIKFEGLKDISESVIFDALKNENVDVRKGSRCDPARVKDAIRIIKTVLASNGQQDVNVDTVEEYLTSQTVILTFVIRKQ
jgi:TonB family protein